MTKQKRIISIKKNLCSEINLAPPSLGGECRSTQWTLRLPLCVPPPEGGSFDITSAACISLPHAIYILHCIAMHSPSLRICRITSRPLKTGLPASVTSPSLPPFCNSANPEARRAFLWGSWRLCTPSLV